VLTKTLVAYVDDSCLSIKQIDKNKWSRISNWS